MARWALRRSPHERCVRRRDRSSRGPVRADAGEVHPSSFVENSSTVADRHDKTRAVPAMRTTMKTFITGRGARFLRSGSPICMSPLPHHRVAASLI